MNIYWDHFTNDYRRFANTGYLNNKLLFQYLLKYIDNNKIYTLADVGCAAGSLYYHLKHRDFKYYGFDLSVENIKSSIAIFSSLEPTQSKPPTIIL